MKKSTNRVIDEKTKKKMIECLDRIDTDWNPFPQLTDVIEEVEVLDKFRVEYRNANRKHVLFTSAHEGYAVLKEEVDKMWDAIKKNDVEHSIEEAIQVGAMALKYIISMNFRKVVRKNLGIERPVERKSKGKNTSTNNFDGLSAQFIAGLQEFVDKNLKEPVREGVPIMLKPKIRRIPTLPQYVIDMANSHKETKKRVYNNKKKVK